MAARPTWKGYLKISLVNIPVKVFPATDAAAKYQGILAVMPCSRWPLRCFVYVRRCYEAEYIVALRVCHRQSATNFAYSTEMDYTSRSSWLC